MISKTEHPAVLDSKRLREQRDDLLDSLNEMRGRLEKVSAARSQLYSVLEAYPPPKGVAWR